MISAQEPIIANFAKKFNDAQSILEKFVACSHSETSSADGEIFPSHLKKVVESHSSSKEEDEDPQPTSTSSTQNRIVQNSIIGNQAPLGTDTNAPARDN